jgi:hypothetical protein
MLVTRFALCCIVYSRSKVASASLINPYISPLYVASVSCSCSCRDVLVSDMLLWLHLVVSRVLALQIHALWFRTAITGTCINDES